LQAGIHKLETRECQKREQASAPGAADPFAGLAGIGIMKTQSVSPDNAIAGQASDDESLPR
jgi:hypothetical protein